MCQLFTRGLSETKASQKLMHCMELQKSNFLSELLNSNRLFLSDTALKFPNPCHSPDFKSPLHWLLFTYLPWTNYVLKRHHFSCDHPRCQGVYYIEISPLMGGCFFEGRNIFQSLSFPVLIVNTGSIAKMLSILSLNFFNQFIFIIY